MTQSTPAAAPATPAAAAPAAPVAAPAAAAPASAAPAPASNDSLIPALAPAAAAPGAPAAAAAPASNDPNSQNAWLYAEGVLGAGNAPDWFLKDKYANVAEQAKAYPELSKRFGSFVGAPKEGKYDIKLPQEIGLELAADHPLLATFQKWGAENQLNQRGFTDLMGMLAQYELQHQPNMAEVKASLGEKADERITTAAQWASTNLGPEGYGLFREATSGVNAAAVFKLVETLISKTATPRLPRPGEDVPNAEPAVLARIQAEHGKRGADGKLLYETDEKHRAAVEKMYQEYYAKAA